MMNRLALVVCAAVLTVTAACTPELREETFTAPVMVGQDLALAGLKVRLRDGMEVSTENRRYPPADQLVWYGDGPGDKKAQVVALMTQAVAEGLMGALTGERSARAEVRVTEFHALTPRSRKSSLQVGVHSIAFDIVLKDVATDEVLGAEYNFRADLKALSGSLARQAAERGDTQKVRIMRHVSGLVRDWASGG